MGENKIFISGKESLVLIGNNFFTRDNFYLRVERARITIGENVFINNYCSLNCLYRISIGDNTIIGANCLIYKSIPANSIVKNNSNLSIRN